MNPEDLFRFFGGADPFGGDSNPVSRAPGVSSTFLTLLRSGGRAVSAPA